MTGVSGSCDGEGTGFFVAMSTTVMHVAGEACASVFLRMMYTDLSQLCLT